MSVRMLAAPCSHVTLVPTRDLWVALRLMKGKPRPLLARREGLDGTNALSVVTTAAAYQRAHLEHPEILLPSKRGPCLTHIIPPLLICLLSGGAPPLPEQPISGASRVDETGLRSQGSTGGVNCS